MLMGRYFQLLNQYRLVVIGGIALAIITALAGIALLSVSGWFISATALAGLSIASAHSFNYFTPGAIVRGLSITRTAGRYGERMLTHTATLSVIARLRAELFGQIARHAWQDNALNSHSASSRLLGDIQHAEGIYLNALVPALVSLICALAYLLCVGLYLPALLGWILLPLLLALVVIPYGYARLTLAVQDELHELRNQQWQQSSSVFSNLRTLTLYQRLNATHQALLASAAHANQREQLNVDRQQRLVWLQQLVQAIAIVLTLWQGLLALTTGQLAGAELFMLLLLTLASYEVLTTNLAALGHFGLGYRALRRIESLCQQPHPEQRHHQQRAEPGLLLEQVSYRYPQANRPVFAPLPLRLADSGWYWLSDPSGAGKTTLFNLISGQLAAEQGRITVYSPNDLTDIGMLPQQVGLLRGTLRYNLCLNHAYTDQQLQTALQLVELEQWWEQLDNWFGQHERMPSGGELKRIGLARVILQDPAIILLDEPSAGLDAARARRIVQRLRNHWHDRLVLISSHDSSLIHPADQQLSLQPDPQLGPQPGPQESGI